MIRGLQVWCLCSAVAASAGCGATTSADNPAAAIVKSAGPLSRVEGDCLTGKLRAGLSESALKRRGFEDLAPQERQVVFLAMDRCLSRQSRVRLFIKSLSGSGGIPKDQVQCAASALATTTGFAELLAKGPAVVEKARAAVAGCAKTG